MTITLYVNKVSEEDYVNWCVYYMRREAVHVATSHMRLVRLRCPEFSSSKVYPSRSCSFTLFGRSVPPHSELFLSCDSTHTTSGPTYYSATASGGRCSLLFTLCPTVKKNYLHTTCTNFFSTPNFFTITTDFLST